MLLALPRAAGLPLPAGDLVRPLPTYPDSVLAVVANSECEHERSLIETIIELATTSDRASLTLCRCASACVFADSGAWLNALPTIAGSLRLVLVCLRHREPKVTIASSESIDPFLYTALQGADPVVVRLTAVVIS
jgi:hypothetical protein